MAYYPEFYAAKRPDQPNMADAAWAQGQLNNQRFALEQERKKNNREGIGQLVKGGSEMWKETTGKTPLQSLLDKQKGVSAALRSGPAPALNPAQVGGSMPTGNTSLASSAMPGTSTGAAGPMSTGVSSAGGAAPAAAAGSKLASAIPYVGIAAGALGGASARSGGSEQDQIKGGVGGASTSALMTFAPALAAAGPVGWAGMAGLAALSLYGMLG